MSGVEQLGALVPLPGGVVRDPGLLCRSTPPFLVLWPLVSNLSYGCKMAAVAADITSAFQGGR